MNKEQLNEIKLVGIQVQTSNALEFDPATAKIGATMQTFFMEGLQHKIANRVSPGRVFAVYTRYGSDEHGPYTYFLGEEVSSFSKADDVLETLVIPAQTYAKFTSKSGILPQVVISMWQQIWGMSRDEIGGKRAFLADFEIYDERCQDTTNAIVDVYIGLVP